MISDAVFNIQTQISLLLGNSLLLLYLANLVHALKAIIIMTIIESILKT